MLPGCALSCTTLTCCQAFVGVNQDQLFHEDQPQQIAPAHGKMRKHGIEEYTHINWLYFMKKKAYVEHKPWTWPPQYKLYEPKTLRLMLHMRRQRLDYDT